MLKLFGAVSVIGIQVVQANPTGEQVVAGAAGFERIGSALTVTQGTDRAVINWNSFSIGAGELTRFVQPSASSAVLNRVLGANNPSQIYGTLQANGQVYLINAAGVFVGPGGLVDTAGFVASTHDISTEDFMKGGDLRFTGNSEAAILNQGRIEARQGDVFLIARQVSNEGQILASDGTVGMISGTEVALHALGPHHYKVRLLDVADGTGARKAEDGIAEVVNEGVIEAANAELAATGNYLSLAIRNDGTVRATGAVANADGSVTLTGGEGDLLNRGVVAALRETAWGKTEGGEISLVAKNVTTDPGSIVTAAGQEKGGEVKIDAKDTVYASGKIEATSSEGAGGKVVMTGERVGLVKAEVDASGATQGGQVLVGGGLSGADPEVRNAKALVMTPDSVIRADATQTGNGGKAILWSDEYTGFYGEILARGGLQGGDGGFVETSSKGNLQALGQADVSAFLGRGGTWLLDPPDVYITTTEANIGTTFGVNSVTFVPLAQNSQVSVDRILYALNNNQDVIIQAGPATKTLFSGLGEVGNGKGDITVSVPIVADLNSTGSLTMNNNWIMSGTSGYGNILIGAKVVVGGNLTLSAADDRGLPQLPNFPTRSDGGQGGKITINAPLYAKGVVSITAGQSIATNTGGTGGSIDVNANIYAGSGLSLIGGDADKGWNTGTAGVPPAFLITPYLLQVPNGTGTGAAIRASGGTAGTVTIQSGVSIYLGNGSSTIRAGTAGNNQQGGSLTIGSSILALGNSVDLTLASGLGLSSGTLSLASTLGVSGVQVDLQSIFGVNNAPTLTSSILNSLTLKSGNQVTVSAPANATTIRLTPYNPENGMWIGQTDISGLSVFRIGTVNGVNSLENLVGVNLFIGTPDSLNPSVSPGAFYVTASYKISDLGTTTQGDWNTIAGTVGVVYAPGSVFTCVNAGTAGTTGTAKILTGDIGIGQAEPISFFSSNVTLEGNASAVSFSGSTGQPYSVSIPSGGSMTFGNGGPLFSNFGGATVDVYIPNGTVDFANVQAPGNNPSAAPGTGTLYLDISNLKGAGIIGDSFIQIARTANSANSGPLNFVGNLTATAGTVLNTAMTGSFNLIAPGAISQTAGILTIPGTSAFTAAGAISLDNLNQFTGAVSLSTSSSGSATIRDANALTLGTLSVAGGLTANSTGALNLGQGTVAAALTASSSGGAVSQAGALSIGGTSDINAGAALIDLVTNSGNNNDFTGAVSLANTGNNTISITDKNSLILGTVSQPGQADFTVTVGAQASSGVTYTLTQTGVISTGVLATSGGNFNVVAPSAASGGLLSMDLSTQNNIIRTLTLTPQNPTQFQDFMIRNIAQSGVNSPINPDPDPGLANLPATLRNLSVLYGTTAGTGLGTGTAPIVLPALPAVESTGNLQLLGTSVTQTAGGVLTANTATIRATGTGGSITLNQSGNDFTGVVTLSTTGNNAISIRDKNSLILGALSTDAGTAVVTIGVGTAGVGGSSLTQQAGTVINSLGTGIFNIVANGPTTSVNLATDLAGNSLANNIASLNVNLVGGANFQDFALRNIAATADTPGAATALSLRDLTLIYDNNLIQLPVSNFNNVTRNLVLTAGGNISQLGTLTVGGASTITSTGGNIDLSTSALNNFTGAVNLSTSGSKNIAVRDQNALLLGNVSMGSTGNGTLTVQSGGVLQQSSGTVISSGIGAVSFDAGANAITLANQNDFRGTVALTGGATSITDVNALTLGSLSTGELTATSTGALNLGSGTVGGKLMATSNGGAINQANAGLNFSSLVDVVEFNAGTGSVTMTAATTPNTPNNVYKGKVKLTAGNADFLVAASDGISRFGNEAGYTVVSGTFTLRSPTSIIGIGTVFNMANGAGGFELTSAQLGRMSVGTLEARASGTGGNLAVGTFNPTGIRSLNLVTSGNGNISADSITVGALSMSSGGTVAFTKVGGLQNNRVQNLGNVTVTTGGMDFQNQTGLNLAGTASMPGRLSLEVAGQFYNQTGLESPLANVQQGSVIKSLSLMGGLPSIISGLAGFSYRYDGVMPTSGNVMSFAVSPLTMFAPNGTVIAGVNLSGVNTGGGQLATFQAGSDSLNWIVSDFAAFTLPAAPRAALDYTMYPQRVEPETRTLPLPAYGQLQKELGRPPTVEEVMAREVAIRDNERIRSGAILERSSFDTANPESEERADRPTSSPTPVEGEIPQANQNPEPKDKTAQSEILENSDPHARSSPRQDKGAGGIGTEKRTTRAYAAIY